MIDVELTRPQDWLDTVAGFYEALYHDLKTPMAILFNYVQAMEKINGLPADAEEYLAGIKRSSFRMAKLIQDANDRSRLKQGLLRPRYVMTDAVAVIRDICDNAHALMLTKNINIVFNTPVHAFIMAMDRQLWERIVLNLLANAKDYSFQGSEIHCNILIEKDKFVLSIRDFGKGISPERVEDVFALYEGDTRRGLRSGLGLYIVRELTKLMDGEVRLLPANPGTEVIISTPASHKPDEQEIMTVDDFFADNMVQMELSHI